MAKLNKKCTSDVRVAKKIRARPDVCLNEEAGIAFNPSMKTSLMLRAISALFGEDGFYRTGKELEGTLRATIHGVANKDPEFVLKLALYARTHLYLRTVPMVLLGEYAMSAGKGKVPHAREYVDATIQRADEITELLAYVIDQNDARNTFKGKVPQVIKNGIARAFTKFDGYQLAKYNRAGEVTLKDAIRITHPTPKDKKQEKIFKQILEDKLPSPETWEVVISTQGSTKETWESIIPKMGYMALLRNLRNFLEKGVEMAPVLERIRDPAAIAKSKQFPFRFYSAWKELQDISTAGPALDALADAVEISVQNLPRFDGKTFVTCDISGSMDTPLSNKSKVHRSEVGCLFGDLLHRKDPQNTIVSVFATDHVPVSLSTRDSAFTNVKKMLNVDTHGCGTDAYKVMNWLVQQKIFVDRIILFSDMQCYSSAAKRQYRINDYDNIYAGLMKYRQTINPKVFVYSFDLANYGTAQFPEDDERVCLAGGFSDKVLNFIPMFERSRADMLAEIEAVTP